MLIGKNINLRLIEKTDLPLIKEWINESNIDGDFEPITQFSLRDLEKDYEGNTKGQWFFLEKKDKTKIGYIAHFLSKSSIAIGYALLPNERSKGYGSEAVQMIVDYLFLSKDIVRVQAETHPENLASQRILIKAGFQKEGIIRKSFFSRGVWRDTALYSVLKEEWKEPKIITKI
ncbi:MAG: GNAT family N-acetyltransferase [Promethearchaeota archaeon]